MPWKQMGIRDQRLEFVLRALKGQETFSQLCRDFDISRPTGYLWLKRYKEIADVEGLENRSRRPHHCPHQTQAPREERVIQLRHQWGWGAKKIQWLLKKEQIHLPLSTLNRIISRHGLIREEDKPERAIKRFERAHPNELWQMDFKGYFLLRSGQCHPFAVLDDHSRFVIGLEPFSAISGREVWEKLVDMFRVYGVPEAILMDHGSPWYSVQTEHGLTWLSVALIKQGIKICFSGVGHPQTQGKIERFNRTLDLEMRHRRKPHVLACCRKLFREIREVYNNERPHEALGMKVPAQIYQPSQKAYQARPKKWEYPERITILHLGKQGHFTYLGRRYHLTKALAGEELALHRLDDKAILQYRHMYLSQLDLRTGILTEICRSKL